ncbi:MAG: hypothetical protein ACI4KF_11165 [Huintestinicola sp.]
MESEAVRDQNFELNRASMIAVRDRFRISFNYNLFVSLPIGILSVIMLNQWTLYSVTTMAVEAATGEKLSEFPICPWAITMILCPVISVLSFLGCRFFYRIPHFFNYLLYLSQIVCGYMLITGRISMISPKNNILFAVLWWIYACAGFYMTDLAHRNFKELDYLKTQEGFPDFDLNMNYMGRSHYVKMRNKWLEKNKKLEYFTPDEMPLEEYETIQESGNKTAGMYGIKAAEKHKNDWFQSSVKTAYTKENTDSMDEISETPFLPEEEYEKDDIRRKPL